MSVSVSELGDWWEAHEEVADSFHLRCEDGSILSMHTDRWFSEIDEVESRVLEMALDSTLDVGCGPGRHSVALEGRGVRVLGVDVAPRIVEIARRRGARAVVRSIFDPFPAAGRWGSALLLDGNIGIGGYPAVLLERMRALIRSDGRVLVEVEGPGIATTELRVRIERSVSDGDGRWFRWARVGIDGLPALAAATGFEVAVTISGNDRWFARLDPL